MEWLRWYHGTVKDPKWRVIAKNAGTSIPNVIAIWAALLENASESEKRGVLSGWNSEDVAACFDVTLETVVTVCNAMQQKVLLHETLTGWEKRNPRRERVDNSTDRVRRFREKKRQVTPSNAEKRLDKSREEEKNTGEKKPFSSPNGNGTDAGFNRFWSVYPKKREKLEAQKVWNRIHPTNGLAEKIIAAVDAAKRSPDWLKNNGQYIPNPAKWLRRGNWEDEIQQSLIGRMPDKPTPVC